MSGTAQVTVTVVHTPACHFCEDAQTALAELAAGYALTIEYVTASSEVGQYLLAAHRPPLFPLILVDGRYFSAGRLPRRKLTRLLDELAAAVA